jgi:hypothetical protein
VPLVGASVAALVAISVSAGTSSIALTPSAGTCLPRQLAGVPCGQPQQGPNVPPAVVIQPAPRLGPTSIAALGYGPQAVSAETPEYKARMATIRADLRKGFGLQP